MKYLVAFMILGFVLVTSCLQRDELQVNLPCEEDCITISGTIKTDQNSATPIENASIELGWEDPGIPIGNHGRLIATGLSDRNGNYSFTFQPEVEELSSGKYYLQVTKEQYHEITNAYYDIETVDTTYHFDIHLPSKAQLVIRFKNFNPSSDDAYFSATPRFDGYGSNGFAVQMFDVEGQQKNTWFDAQDAPFNEFVLSGETAGNQYTYLNILIKKNGTRVDLLDSIYIGRNETGIFEIEY